MSILVAFFAHKGASFTEFLWVQSIYALALLVLDVPAGYLSDRFSRKKVLISGATIMLLGHLTLLLSYGFLQLMSAGIILAIGGSLVSGSGSAMLYDGLLLEGKEDLYNKYEGRMQSWMAYGLATAGLVGSFLYPIHPDLPQLLSCILKIGAIITAFMLVEPPIHKSHKPESPIKEMRSLIHYALRGHEEIPWLIFYSSIICGGTMLGTWLTQPYWEAAGIPIWLFGVLFFITQAVRGICLAKASLVFSYIKPKTLGISLLIALCSGFFLQGVFVHPVGIILTLLPGIIFGFAHIMIISMINQRVESRMRATILSTESMMWRLVFAVAAPIVGWFHHLYGLSATFYASGILWLIMGALPVYILHKKSIL